MVSGIFVRRSAERFSDLLDRPVSDQPASDPMLLVSRQLTELAIPTAETDPQFRAKLRQRLMAVAAVQGIGTEPAPEPAAPSSARRTAPRAALVVGLAAGVLALSGVSAASGSAVPGDALYGVKRQTERAQLALAGSDVNKGQLNLEFARTRLAEAKAVRGDAETLSRVLAEMDAETKQGAQLLHGAAVDRRDPAALDAMDGFVAGQRRDMVDLVTSLDGPKRDRAGASLGLLDDVAKRSGSLRNGLSCTQGNPAGTDGLGPIPRQCAALPVAAPPVKTPARESPKASREARSGESAKPSGAAKPSASAADTGGAAADPYGSNAPAVPLTSPSASARSGGLLGDLLRGLTGS